MAVTLAVADGMHAWIEADLAKRWLQGAASFDAAVARVAALARLPGVAGIKIADELGYHDGYAGRPDLMRSFVRAAATALRRAAPGRRILIDLVVPQLGCLPGSTDPVAMACFRAAAQRHPGITLGDIDALLATRSLDVVDLSTGLLSPDEYRSMGSSLDEAQRAAWGEVRRRGWQRLTVLQARKALAHPGSFTGDPAADLTAFLDIPLEEGARAVDVWTWRQRYDGQVYRLTDPGARSNPLWNGLLIRHQRGDVLFTHFSPSSVELSTPRDLRILATVFRSVFIAAGTG